MGNYAWATDIHLDFVSDYQLIEFGKRLIASNPEGIILSGDLSTANQLVYHLAALERVVQRPIYFVLGNHDYYNGSIEDVRKKMKDVTNMSQYLRYLPNSLYIALSQSSALIGHDGWYDARNGNWKISEFQMSDWTTISEFAAVSQRGKNLVNVIDVAQKLAHEATLHIHNAIKSAVRYHNNIVIVTHFPPFAESHMHENKPGDAGAHPWFTSKVMGDMLLDASKSFPKVNFTVFAGHTHGKYSGKFADNLTVHVGGAEYRYPALQEVVQIP